MTIGSLILGGFRLIRERPGAMLIWTLIELAVAIGASFWMAALVQGLFDAALAGEQSLESLQLSFATQTILVGVVSGVISTVLYAAVQRAILRPAEGGPAWLRFGMDEIRFLVLLLLYSIVFGVGLLLVVLILAPMAAVGPGGAPIFLIVVFVLAFVVCAYFGTKLSLTFPLTLKERAFAIGEGWSLSNGRFWTLFGAYLIIFLILLAVGIATAVVTQPEYLSAMVRYGPNSMEADLASLAQYQKIAAGTIDAPIIVGWVLTSVQGAIGLVLFGGAAATAVQELTEDEAGLSETFS